jgi:hypothetical protein
LKDSGCRDEGISEDQFGVIDRCGFSSLSIDVESRRGLPGVAHGGKLIHSMVTRFNK